MADRTFGWQWPTLTVTMPAKACVWRHHGPAQWQHDAARGCVRVIPRQEWVGLQADGQLQMRTETKQSGKPRGVGPAAHIQVAASLFVVEPLHAPVHYHYGVFEVVKQGCICASQNRVHDRQSETLRRGDRMLLQPCSKLPAARIHAPALRMQSKPLDRRPRLIQRRCACRSFG